MYNKGKTEPPVFIIWASHYQSTYKIGKQYDKDFLSYRENDELSADAVA